MSGKSVTRKAGSPVRLLMLLLAITALLGALPAAAPAAPGELDTSFGTGGVVYTDLDGPIYTEDYARDVATDSSDRVVVVGHSERNGQTESAAVVVRYTDSGELDPTFGGGDGIAQLHFGVGSFDSLASVAIDGSGRIVASGSTASDIHCTTYCDPVIIRLTQSGQLDPAFSGDGVLTISGEERSASSVAIDGSGRILAACGSAVYRLTESGALDATFGELGRAPVEEAYYDLTLDSGGRIVVAGDYGVERLLSNGQLDTSFNGSGSESVDIAPGSSDFVYAVAVDASDRIVAGGISFPPGSGTGGRPFVVRFTPSGVLDESFSGDGIVLGSDEGLVTDLLVDHAGRYLATGYSNELDTSNVLIRYLPNGTLDTSFGGGFGFARVPFFADDVAVDTEQRIVVSGVGGEEGGDEIDFAAARYLGDIEPSPGPGPGPGPSPSPTTSPSSAVSPPAPSSSPPPSAMRGTAAISGVARVRGGQVLLRMHCAGSAPCMGLVKLIARIKAERTIQRHGQQRIRRRARKVVIGTAHFQIPAGKTALVRVRLTAKGKRLLRGAGKRGLTATVTGLGVTHRSVRLTTVQPKRHSSSTGGATSGSRKSPRYPGLTASIADGLYP